MALPTYDKSKRKKSFTMLPKGAYVVKIMSAKETKNKNNGGSHIAMAFDIAEGEYKDFYKKQFDANTSEDKKWNNDAVFRLTVPDDNSEQFVWDNWNSFFADLEDSNNGFVFKGNAASIKGKLIGGKFHIEQTEYNGRVCDHTRLRWTCIAEDVRQGKAGALPNDKLVTAGSGRQQQNTMPATPDGFVKIPDDVTEEEIPFD